MIKLGKLQVNSKVKKLIEKECLALRKNSVKIIKTR